MRCGRRLFLGLAGLGWLSALTPARLRAQPPTPPGGYGEALYARRQYAAALPWLKKSAAAGSAQSQFLLGTLYHNGSGVRADLRAAAHWFQLAAGQGHPAAQYELGVMYQFGEGGLPRDDRRAIDLYMRSARQSFEPANLILGIDYELGDGIPRSRSQAISYLQHAGNDGLFMANVLAAADAPARLDGALALGNYLSRLPNSPVPAGWAEGTAPQRRAGEAPTLAALLNSQRHVGAR